nr:hypothetical protein [uncultured Blautia sp.]
MGEIKQFGPGQKAQLEMYTGVQGASLCPAAPAIMVLIHYMSLILYRFRLRVKVPSLFIL